MNSKLKKEITLKDGRTFTKGSQASVKFAEVQYRQVIIVTIGNESFKTKVTNGHKILTGFDSPPSIEDLEDWSCDGICETVTGHITEPDGTGPDGSPSWLLALGYI